MTLASITAKLRRDSRETLRFGSTNAALVAFHTSMTRASIAKTLAQEEARQKLAAITGPDAVDTALTEADRRSRDAGMDLVHAYTSVAEDIATGRWDPR